MKIVDHPEENAAMPDLTDEQQAVYDRIESFIVDPRPRRPWFSYEGPAGTGKTVLLSKLAQSYPLATLCAFTGKAASVLARKAGMRTTTIHSAIYTFLGEDEDNRPMFESAHDRDSWRGQLALVDESSTVDVSLAKDLLATGCKVVTCGDSNQLPPVNGEPFFRDADAMLHTVHRQAWDSPIIRQAHAVKERGVYAPDGDDFRVERHIGRDDIVGCDIILCWRNATRIALNRLKRAHLGVPEGSPVVAGEPLMCLRNDHRLGLLNGAVYPSLIDRRPWDPVAVVNERGDEVEVDARIEDLEPPPQDRKVLPFALAYCATSHKFQGSEANFVIAVDDYDKTEDRKKWLYTTFTRAAKRIIVQHD